MARPTMNWILISTINVMILGIVLLQGGCRSIDKVTPERSIQKAWLKEGQIDAFNKALHDAFDEWKNEGENKREFFEYEILGPRTIYSGNDSDEYHWEISHPEYVNVVLAAPSAVEPVNETLTKVKVVSKDVENIRQFSIRLVWTYEVEKRFFSEVIQVKSGERPEQSGDIEAWFQVEDFANARKHFGLVFAETFYCIKVFLKNGYDVPVRVDAGSIELPIFYISKMSEETKDPYSYQFGYYRQFRRGVFAFEYDNIIYRVESAFRVPMNFTAIINTFASSAESVGYFGFRQVAHGMK